MYQPYSNTAVFDIDYPYITFTGTTRPLLPVINYLKQMNSPLGSHRSPNVPGTKRYYKNILKLTSYW